MDRLNLEIVFDRAGKDPPDSVGEDGVAAAFQEQLEEVLLRGAEDPGDPAWGFGLARVIEVKVTESPSHEEQLLIGAADLTEALIRLYRLTGDEAQVGEIEVECHKAARLEVAE